MLGSPQLGGRYYSSVVRLMTVPFKNMKKKLKKKAERVGECFFMFYLNSYSCFLLLHCSMSPIIGIY